MLLVPAVVVLFLTVGVEVVVVVANNSSSSTMTHEEGAVQEDDDLTVTIGIGFPVKSVIGLGTLLLTAATASMKIIPQTRRAQQQPHIAMALTPTGTHIQLLLIMSRLS